MMKHSMYLLALIWVVISCQEVEKTSLNTAAIEQEILSKGNSVVRALNEANIDTLIRDFWQSDSSLFLIDGAKIHGYDSIKAAFYNIPNRRKNLVLDVDNEEVYVLSSDVAIHVVEFRQKVTHMNDSTSYDQGVWSTVYKKMDNDWKIIMVHESHLIDEDN